MYPSQVPKFKPHPVKPNIGGVSMETKFKPPIPAGKLPGSAPPPGKLPASSISALKGALEKGNKEEGKRSPPATCKPLGSKFPLAGEFPGAPVPKSPPSWKKPPLKEVSSQSPSPNQTGFTLSVVSSVQQQKKLFMGRASESELQKEVLGKSPSPNETGSAHNVSSSVQLQKKLFMGRASESGSQKEVTTRDTVSSAPNTPGSAQPQKKALPSLVTLGMCPAKPRRPPHVELHNYGSHGSDNSSPDDVFPPPPLPVRIVDEESYDDIGLMNSKPDGYVTADLVEVDGSSWPPVSLDVYDDVGGPDQSSSLNKAPESENIDEDIYDVLDDGGSDPGFPPPPSPLALRDDGDTYDDVGSSNLPSTSTMKTEDLDPKKKKKIEKEEKEFRKKFKYDQEIQVLYEATVLPVLACKKFSSKHLVIRPGDVISVITSPQDGKIIARNNEGKFGFVSVSNIQQNSDIYDDVREDCVYDND